VTIGVVLNTPLISRTATLLLSGGALGSMTIVGFAPATSATTPDTVMTNTVMTAATSTATSRQHRRAATAVRYAKAQIGDRYKYGGNGPNSWDCSGLARASWRKAGVKLPRVTYSQYRAVKKKVSWSHLHSGDLLFFYGKGHVGIYVGKGYMVHAPSSGKRVQKVKLGSYYRHHLSGAVRPGA
jgi:cell wall-associated NlpC family hydrolase